MNYVIAVLTDRIAAEAAYSALEQEGIPLAQMGIVGPGYKSADDYPFIDPRKPAQQQARLMAFWLVPFGFLAGFAFNLSTQYQLVPEVGVVGNRLIGALLGAMGGAMGSVFVGGGVGLTLNNKETLSYRTELKQGKYLVIVGGAPNLTNKATRILKQIAPGQVQSYVESDRV